MNEVATSIGFQAVVGAVTRTSPEDFNLGHVLMAIAEMAQSWTGARGVAIERAAGGAPTEALLMTGIVAGTPRRLPVIAEGSEIGFIALYGAAMLAPAIVDRTQVLADLAAMAMTRAGRQNQADAPLVDETKYRLITGVGLNLRNTLGAATGYMQLAEMEGPLNHVQQEYTTRSRRAIGSAISLISDLLELTRADAGKLAFDREPVNLQAVAREAARKHIESAELKRCTIQVTSSLKNPVLFTDSSYVQQIIDVLVYNAVRYSRPEGDVHITVDLRSGRRTTDPVKWMCVSVRDSGAGIPEADRVFEEVHRVEQSKGNVRFKLAICRRIARLLGGDLTLETEKDVGSVFTIWLPAPSV